MVARLREQYDKQVKPALVERFRYANVMAVPRLKKIVISMGIGQAEEDKAKLEAAQQQLGLIAGQKPVVTKATKSISNFKLREGMQVGLKVTLRGQRMYEFFDRLVTLAIPRVKDFRGLNPKGFDHRGKGARPLADAVMQLGHAVQRNVNEKALALRPDHADSRSNRIFVLDFSPGLDFEAHQRRVAERRSEDGADRPHALQGVGATSSPASRPGSPG